MKQKIQDIIVKVRGAPKKQKILKSVKLDKSNRGKFIFGILVFIMVLIFSAKVISALSNAVIRVTLHQETITVDTVLKTSKTMPADLSFETMQLEIVEQKTAKATGIKKVENKASGQIIIYNNYSAEPQPLMASTRFETPDGKIYRLAQKIVVPGKPGSIEATVYADLPGETYNIGLTDFTIPGFKGGPRYEKFYGRSKTLMTGGAKGEVPVVSEQDFNTLKQALENSLKDQLVKKALLQIPKNFVLYENAMKITFVKNNIPSTADVVLEETGTLFAYLFSKEDLSSALVKKYLSEKSQNKISVENLEQLNFEFVSEDKGTETLIFKITGQAKFVWVLDEEKLKESLVASPKNVEEVFKTFPEIDQVAVVFRPSWWRFFPTETSKIKIESI